MTNIWVKLGLSSAVLLMCATFVSCVSSQSTPLSEADIQTKNLPRSGVGMVGITLNFEDIPQDLYWDLLLELRNESTEEKIVMQAAGRDWEQEKSFDKSPWMYSLPPGVYSHVRTSIVFPKGKNSLYYLSADHIDLSPKSAIPKIKIVAGHMLYLGEISLGAKSFVPGKAGHESGFRASWNPRANMMGVTWDKVREQIAIDSINENAGSQGGMERIGNALMMYDRTSDAAFEAMKSGFSDGYSLILVRALNSGFAFFEDRSKNVYRVQSAKFGGFNAYAYAAVPGESLSLRGFCFADEKKVSECDTETIRVATMYSDAPFEASTVRYRGTVEHIIDGKAELMLSLDLDTRAAVLKEIPQATFNEFVSGKEIIK